MKRTISLILCLCLLLGVTAAAAQTEEPGSSEARFVTVRLPYDKEVTWSDENKLAVRFTDTGEIIPLSSYYDGAVFATVPVADRDRPMEIVLADQSPTFPDLEEFPSHYLTIPIQRGVLKGTSSGLLEPNRALTRAEGAALLTRLLGVQGTKPSGYADLTKSAWYGDALCAAREYGIIAPAERFYPDRTLTREEFTVMVARAAQALGWLGTEPSNSATLDYLTDGADIAPWAQPYFRLLGEKNALLTDYEFTGEYDENGMGVSLPYAYPQQVITREEGAQLLWNLQRYLPLYPSKLALEYGFDQQMPIIDGSTSTYPFTSTVYWKLFYNGSNHPSYPAAHSKSHASYERLINGEVDMLFASVYPASDILELAESKGVELELIPIAYDAMVFFTNADNPATGLTSEQITNIYVDNAYDNWNQVGGPDAKLVPYCRNNDSGSHAQMERHFLNGKEINEEIRRETTSIAMASVLTDVDGAKRSDPLTFALGYSIYYYYQVASEMTVGPDALKLLSIDGVSPTDETIADGTYPLSNNTYVVLRKDTPENSPARKMAQFMLTDEGQNCVINAGYGPLDPQK